MKIQQIINRLIDAPSADPDDARRRRLLNILLLSTTAVAAVTMGLIALTAAAGLLTPSETLAMTAAMLSLLMGIAAIYVINWRVAGWAASALFLSVLIASIFISDDLQNVTSGRSLVAFAVPIVIASILLRPYASFAVAGLISLAIVVIPLVEGMSPNPYAILVLAFVAFASWIGAQALERALKQMRSEASTSHAILTGIADGVVVFDPTGQVTAANPAIGKLLGRPHQEIVGVAVETLVRETMRAADPDEIVPFLRGEAPSGVTLRLLCGERTCIVNVASIQEASGQALGTVAVFHDFTRQVELERVKSNFISIASHELRTPISAILGYAEILQENIYGPLAEKQRGAISRIMTNAGEMLRLANNLLDRAQMEAGTLTLHIAPFALDELIANVLGVMRPLAHASGLQMVVYVAEDIPATLYGDKLRLHQILTNLVSNAVKFTKEGSVRIRVYKPDTDHWALQVADTGCGIPEEAQSAIFDPFRKAGRSEEEVNVTRGAGVGLSLVKQLVGMMGGALMLKSEVGQGSTFTVILPIIQEQDLPPLGPQRASLVDGYTDRLWGPQQSEEHPSPPQANHGVKAEPGEKNG